VNACQFSVILFIILLLEIIAIVTIFVFREEVRVKFYEHVTLHCKKNIRISTDILWRVFHILTEHIHCNVGPGFIISSIYGYQLMRNRFR